MAKLFIFLLVTIFVFIQCNVANNKVIKGNYAEPVYERSIFEGNSKYKAKNFKISHL